MNADHLPQNLLQTEHLVVGEHVEAGVVHVEGGSAAGYDVIPILVRQIVDAALPLPVVAVEEGALGQRKGPRNGSQLKRQQQVLRRRGDQADDGGQSFWVDGPFSGSGKCGQRPTAQKGVPRLATLSQIGPTAAAVGTAVAICTRTEGARVEVIVVVLHRDGRRGGPAEVPVLLMIFLLVWIRPTSRPLIASVVSLSAFVVSVSVSIHYRYYRSARRWKLLGRIEIAAAATLTITTVAFVSVVTVSSDGCGGGG